MIAAQHNTRWGEATIDELIRLGSPHFCVVAGSRSTPLAAAAVKQDRVPCDVFTDERSAAFFALGVGQATGRPATVITTSGTAVANLAPAVHEASAAGVPLLALTADRPPELRQTGANQTIEQPGIFAGAVRWSFDLPCPTEAIPMRALRSTIDHAYARTLVVPPGPVHLNCMYRTPLGPTDAPSTGALSEDTPPLCVHATPLLGLRSADLARLVELLAGCRRGLIVLGAMREPREQRAALQLANHLGWPVFADVASGLRLHAGLRFALDPFDALLSSEAFRAACAPECVLQLGGPVVSGRFLDWRSSLPNTTHVLIRPDPRRQDPTHTVSWQLSAHLSSVERDLREDLAPSIDTDWRDALRTAADAVGERWSAAFHDDDALSEPAVTRALAEELNASSGWMLSNSMPIRNVDLFAERTGAPPTVITNRGASGIDGILSTAIGWAHAKAQPVTVLLGDQALLHDLNALTLLNKAPHPITVVVINNGGGGIFSFLPIAEDPELVESTFAAAHEWRFRPIAEGFGIEAIAPTDLSAFRAAIADSVTRPGARLIEVCTERVASRDLHHTLRARAVEAVEDALKR